MDVKSRHERIKQCAAFGVGGGVRRAAIGVLG